MQYRHSLLLLAVILLCGVVRADSTQPTASSGKVVIIGKPDRSIVTGDVIVYSPATVTGLAFSHSFSDE